MSRGLRIRHPYHTQSLRPTCPTRQSWSFPWIHRAHLLLWQYPAMRTTIDSAGRVVIPKDIRERVGLAGGHSVEITERDGLIEIEPAPTPIKLKRYRSGTVAVPDDDLPQLTDDIVRDTIERTRR